ncbi:unnamed protein product [Rotaria sp. Silwood2]|nr:unnamed protein product [Rotaria sp. Silwood2]CAF3914748.1 unnamed protein product [Rotaria sp. Silwood2]
MFILVSYSLNCFVCDSKEDEHCPETWTRKDILPIECGGPDGVQNARFCIKTIAVFGGVEIVQSFHLSIGNLFTNRIENYNIINGFEYEAILADNFLILLKPTPRIIIDF